MRRTALLAATLAVVIGGAGAASAGAGTGSVIDTLVATVAPGTLVIAGTGANVGLAPTPGAWSSAAGATVLTVTDATGSSNGWSVTATYSDPAAGTALGASNVRVTAFGVTGAIAGSALSLATDAPLTSPVTIASTGAGTGLGVTAMTASYKVLVPVTAAVGSVYGATVTYTVASVR